MKKWLLFMMPLLAIFISVITWWQIQPTPQLNVTMLTMPIQCQLHTNECTIDEGDVKIRLSITPRPIPIAKTLNVNASIQGVQVTKVQLDVNGSNMYMGYNRVNLMKTDHDDWQGKSILSFCTIDEMQWQLTLLIDLMDGRQIQAPFPLTTPFKAKAS